MSVRLPSHAPPTTRGTGHARLLVGVVRPLIAVTGILGAGVCWSGVVAAELSPAAHAALGVTSLAVGLWASEVLALPVTALLVLALLAITGAVPRRQQAFVGFQSPVLFFLLGSAGLGIAAEQTGIADRLAGWLLARSRGSGRRLLAELLLSLPLQALVIPSAISRNAVLVPVYDRVLAYLGRPRRLGAAVMLSLGVLGPLASSALLTGGTSSVATAQALGGFTWVSWFVALAPPYYVVIVLGCLLIWLVCRPESSLASLAAGGAPPRPRVSAGGWRVVAVSVGTSVLWVLDRLTGWPPAVPALLALVILLTPRLGVMRWQEFAARAPWGICIVLAAAVSLADALTRTGAAAWVARGLFGRLAAPGGASATALVVFLVAAVLTLGIPNRAAAITLILPLATAYAAGGPLSATAAGLIVMLAVDVETLYPAQTAATLLAYDRGYFDARLLACVNLATLLLAALVAAGIALSWWSVIGLPPAR